jgi:hypothetical protein
MVILDSDHMSLLEWTSRSDTQKLRARLNQLPVKEVATTIISFGTMPTSVWLAK